MKLAISVTVTLLLAASALVAAQNADPAWIGEWGSFHRIVPSTSDQYLGNGLSITDCTGQQCKASLIVNGQSGSHCEGSGNLQIASPSEAVISIASFGYKCSVALEKTSTGKPAITAKTLPGDCSSYCTSGVDFSGSYPLRSTSRFFGDNLQACYAGAPPSQTALCTSQELSSLHVQWRQLVWAVADLGSPALDELSEQEKILTQCDGAAQPAICLTNAFHQSTQMLDARKVAWNSSVTQPGSINDAKQKIAAIAGHYRHSFQNGDVEGDTYRSTDTLRIAKASEDSIHYSLQLNFYNGHGCSRSGVAHYKAGGMFVDQTQDDPTEKACFFEIIPTAKGVLLGDPTGACRETDCGARGGYVNKSFSFSQRLKPAR